MSRTEDSGNRPGIEPGGSLDFTVEALPDAVVVARSDTGRIIDANDAAGELFQCKPADLLGRYQSDLHPTGRASEYAAAFRRGIKNERVNRLQNGDPLYIKTDDGHRTPVEINARQQTVDGQSVVVGVFREITDQLERQRQLEAATARLEALLDALPLPVTVLDLDGTVSRWNRAAEETFGYAAEDIVGEQRSLFLDDLELDGLLDRLADGTVLSEYETVLRACDGRRIPVELYARPLYEGETMTGVIGVAIDISDRQRRVQQLEVLYRLLRHNLRNELGIIRGWADEINAGSSDTNAAERISNASQDLLEMSEQAKQIQSNLTADKQTRPIAVEAVVSMLRGSAETPTVELMSSASLDDVEVPAQIEHAIGKLGETVLNQVDAGQLELAVEAQNRNVIIELNGEVPLLPVGERALLENGQETPLEHGSGIEIAHAYLLITSAGGDIALEDGESSASTLRLELPRVDPDTTADSCRDCRTH